jgi:HEAT repeat protein
MGERALFSTVFWQAWAGAAALAVLVSGSRLRHPSALVEAPARVAAPKPSTPEAPLTEWAAPAPPAEVSLLTRLAAAETSSERCELLGSLDASEDPQYTYAIAAVLEHSQLISVRVCATQALGQQRTEAARSWLVDLADDQEPAVHAAALDILAASDIVENQSVVLEATHSEDADVRVSAVSALLKAGREQAFAAFAAVLPSVEDPTTLSSLITALGQSHDARALPLLLSLAENADKESHFVAISALQALGLPGTVTPLLSLLEEGSDVEFNAAVNSLSEVAPDRSEAKLRSLLSSSNSDRQTMALRALLAQDIPDRSTLLHDALRSTDVARKRTALNELMRKPDPSLETELTAIALGDDEGPRFAALSALSRLDTPSARATLQRASSHQRGRRWKGAFRQQPEGSSSEIRAQRIIELEHDEDPMDALRELSADAAEEAQAAALKYVEGPGLLPKQAEGRELGSLSSFLYAAQAGTVQKFLADTPHLEPEQRRVLLQVLAQRGDLRFADVLKGALHDSDLETRSSAMRGLVALGDETARAELPALVRATEPGERLLAIELLGAGSGSAATDALETLAQDTNADVASSALHALQRLVPERVEGLAERALRAASSENRASLLGSFSDMKGSLTRPLYEQALNDADDAVAVQALQSLTNLAGPESARRLLAVVNDTNRGPEVRAEAASGLRQLGGPLAQANRALLDSLSPPPDPGANECNVQY